ncbi:MAG TPA: PAS domain S-box protein [Desulfuromonadaceae bacterium]
MKSSGNDPNTLAILYAEDEADARELLSSVLTMKYPDVRLHLAETGQMGLELFRAHRPGIVITDINMPMMDGIQMSGEIKALEPETVIIALTAHSDTKYLLNAIEIGINHYVLKPVDYGHLFAIIDKSRDMIMLEQRVKRQSAHIRKLSRAVEQSTSMVMITDADGTIEYVNSKFAELTGYTADEVRGNTPHILKSDATSPEQYGELRRAIVSGKEWHGKLLIRKKNGETFWAAISASPILDEAGAITHFVAIIEDITARMRTEQEIIELNSALTTRAQELEAANRELEAFNSTVSHDLRSPITAIHGFTQVLLEKTSGLDEDSISYITIIHKEIRRMEAMIKSLLKFSRLSRQSMEREEVNLSELASTIAMELQLRHPERKVAFTITEGACCNGDPTLLRVVMENLIGNAWKYSSRKESADIAFGIMDHGEKPTYYVRDNGAGFDQRQAGRLFGAFQRLHNEDDFEGFGIGLATTQRIIQRHGGDIRAEGEVGKGATFYFTLGG